ncbi:hypothetical protein J5TS2_01430 [Brevibacillus halotolerans]|nr:hypothetical protein J5TS2_01430 [Brevibacillus halotolerans]
MSLDNYGDNKRYKIRKRVKSILEGLSNNTDGKLFERAHELFIVMDLIWANIYYVPGYQS